MASRLLVHPDALSLLRFWDETRQGRFLPEWRDDIAHVPVQLLPNLAITEQRPEPGFRYVGSEVLKRWGGIAGAQGFASVATGALARYLRSMETDAMHTGKPVFSLGELALDDEANPVMMARLYAPFVYRGSAAPRIILGLQLFLDPDRSQVDLRRAAFVDEHERWLVAHPQMIVSRIEEALGRGGPAAARGAVDAMVGSAIVKLAREAGTR